MARVALVPLLLLASSVSFAQDGFAARVDAALDRGAVFLLQRQGADGAWRSQTYGAFRDGYSQTPVVLSALLFAPPRTQLSAAYDRGVDFLATLVGPSGAVERHLDYPVYAGAGALFVLSVAKNPRHLDVRDALVAYLRARQLDERHGWQPTDLAYGGWGYFAGPLTKPASGAPASHLLSSNLSSTLFAVGALQLAGVPWSDPIFGKARRFVERCQNWSPGEAFDAAVDDGGFFFTPTNALQNKAGVARDAPRRYRSYGSMTADGLRALLRLGHGLGSPRATAAAMWLRKTFEPARPAGAYPANREVQRRSVFYYWSWTMAHVFMHLGDSVRAQSLAEAVLMKQGSDGAWRNPSTDLREDDPLVATPLAMSTLAIARFVVTGRWRTGFDASGKGASP
jgi:hypothetical protein